MVKKKTVVIEETGDNEQVVNVDTPAQNTADSSDSEEILKPKKARTPAQIAAFQKAREVRAANIKNRTKLALARKQDKSKKVNEREVVRTARRERAKEVKQQLKTIKKKKPPTPSSSEVSSSSSASSYSSEVSSSSSSSEEEPRIILKKKPKAVKPKAPPKKKKQVVYVSSSTSSGEDNTQGNYGYEEPTATASYLKYFQY